MPSMLPGRKLEQDFARWMRKEAGYTHVELNKRVPPTAGGTTYEVDVYAARHAPRSVRAAAVGLVLYAVVTAGYLLRPAWTERTLEAAVRAVVPGLAEAALVLVLTLGVAVAAYNYRKLETRAFVECKDWKGKVGRPQISRVIGRMQNMGDPKRRARGREEWFFVASNGFTGPALEAAAAHGIRCYVPRGRRFEEVTEASDDDEAA